MPVGRPGAPGARPVGVTIVGVMSIVAGAMMAFAGVAALLVLTAGASVAEGFASAYLPSWMGAVGALVLVIALLAFLVLGGLAALTISAGVGSLRGRSWGWVLTLIVLGLIGVNALLGVADGDVTDLFGVAVAGLVGWYYFTPEVRAWFGRR